MALLLGVKVKPSSGIKYSPSVLLTQAYHSRYVAVGAPRGSKKFIPVGGSSGVGWLVCGRTACERHQVFMNHETWASFGNLNFGA
jgi:hypothetical protein